MNQPRSFFCLRCIDMFWACGGSYCQDSMESQFWKPPSCRACCKTPAGDHLIILGIGVSMVLAQEGPPADFGLHGPARVATTFEGPPSAEAG